MEHRHSTRCAATLCIVAGATAISAAPIRDVIQINETYPSSYWNVVCDLPEVIYKVTGTLRIKVHAGAHGAKEIDTVSDFKQVFVAPSTGGSFTQILGASKYSGAGHDPQNADPDAFTQAGCSALRGH